MNIKVILGRFVCTDFSWYHPLVSGNKNVLFLMQGGHISRGNFMTYFQVERGGQRPLPVLVVS